MEPVRHLAKIVPAPSDDGCPQITQGTKVLVDGKELGGITKLTLVATPDDVWRATIECIVRVPEVAAMIVSLGGAVEKDGVEVTLEDACRILKD